MSRRIRTSAPGPVVTRDRPKISGLGLASTGIEHLTEPAFHRSPEGEPALVFTDFGADIVQMAADAGLSGRIVRPFADDPRLRRLFVVVATKAA